MITENRKGALLKSFKARTCVCVACVADKGLVEVVFTGKREKV